MKKAKRFRPRTIVSAVALLVAVPLVALPTSAAQVGGNGFFIHAQNIVSPEFQAEAGLAWDSAGNPIKSPLQIPGFPLPGDGTIPGGSTTPSTGGGTPTPGPGGGTGSEPIDRILTTYACGPMKLDITESMADWADSNLSKGDINSEGWMYFRHNGGEDPSMLTSDPFPRDGSKPSFFFASSNLEGSAFAAYGVEYGQGTDLDQCIVQDTRSAPKAGNLFAYSKGPLFNYNGSETAKHGLIAEGRYMETENRTIRTIYGESVDGAKSVLRLQDSPQAATMLYGVTGVTEQPFKSDRYPFSYTIQNDGSKIFFIWLTSTVDGYNAIEIYENPDGSGIATYQYREDGSYPSYSYAVRKSGPVTVYWNSSRQIEHFSTLAEGDEVPTRVPGNTAAQYNAATGQNWNGSYAKITDFDTTIPAVTR